MRSASRVGVRVGVRVRVRVGVGVRVRVRVRVRVGIFASTRRDLGFVRGEFLRERENERGKKNINTYICWLGRGEVGGGL